MAHKEPEVRPPRLFKNGPDWEFQDWDYSPYWSCNIASIELQITYFDDEPGVYWFKFCTIEGYDLHHSNGRTMDEGIEYLRGTFKRLIKDLVRIVL